MYFTSLHLWEYLQWLSILSVIKKYLHHFLKSNFEMLAKPSVLFLRISLSMYEQSLENFMLFSKPDSDSLFPSLGGLPNISWCRYQIRAKNVTRVQVFHLLIISKREKSGLHPQTIVEVQFSTFNYKTG